jgi:serine/threonine protein phosphatase 1
MRRLSDLMGLRHDHTQTPCVPQGMAVFAIGDIHGCVQPLARLHQKILEVAETLPHGTKKIAVYLGDYGDYGPAACDVIDLLVSAPLFGFKSIHLLGDQDLHFLRFMRGGRDILRCDRKLVHWLNELGGLQTLRSYGVNIIGAVNAQSLVTMRTELLRKIPTDHLSFYQNLQMSHVIGDFFFSHAGARNSREANAQLPTDLLRPSEVKQDDPNIRMDKIIVHGHMAPKTRSANSTRIGVCVDPHRTGQMNALMIAHQRLAWIDV